MGANVADTGDAACERFSASGVFLNNPANAELSAVALISAELGRAAWGCFGLMMVRFAFSIRLVKPKSSGFIAAKSILQGLDCGKPASSGFGPLPLLVSPAGEFFGVGELEDGSGEGVFHPRFAPLCAICF
jgi:hypothetical protein